MGPGAGLCLAYSTSSPVMWMDHVRLRALCVPLLCKLAGIMAQLGSRLIEFHPIKYEYHAV